MSKYFSIGRIGIGFNIDSRIKFSYGILLYDCVTHYYISVPKVLIEFTIES